MSFNIASKKAAEMADIEIIDPETLEPMIGEAGAVCSVTLYSPGTKPYLAAQAAANARYVKRLKAKGNVEETPDEINTARATFLTAITVSFNNFNYNDKPDGPEAWRAAYLDSNIGWLPTQLNSRAGDWSNFMQAASSS